MWSSILDPDICMYDAYICDAAEILWRTNGRTDKPILGVGCSGRCGWIFVTEGRKEGVGSLTLTHVCVMLRALRKLKVDQNLLFHLYDAWIYHACIYYTWAYDTCIQDACIHDACNHDAFFHDACIRNSFPWCIYPWCMFQGCICPMYPWCMYP